MKRLTTDTPDGAFQTMMNYVYGNNGWACIRSDGEHGGVPLTTWAKKQCALRGCDGLQAQTEQEIDSVICECMMDVPDCPIALAYCFASQAVHMRSRLKQYEDILFGEDGKERLTLDDIRELVMPTEPLTVDEMREMDGEPVWITRLDGSSGAWALVDGESSVCKTVSVGEVACFANYERYWLAYRRRPEEDRNA